MGSSLKSVPAKVFQNSYQLRNIFNHSSGKISIMLPFKVYTRLMVSVRNADGEIYTFEDISNIGPEEDFWKINEFPMHNIYPSFQLIDVHLQGKNQSILF